jgi:proteic killer suppression protein
MIKTFATKETAALFANEKIRRLPPEILQVTRRKLVQLHRVSSIEELRIPPESRLEKLSCNRDGQWSIQINNQWRICFRFEAGDAFDVEITDYH